MYRKQQSSIVNSKIHGARARDNREVKILPERMKEYGRKKDMINSKIHGARARDHREVKKYGK